MPDLEGAGIIIENKKKVDLRAKSRPDLNRAEEMTPSETLILNQNPLPAANLNKGADVKLWAWPGFGSGSPKPKIRSGERTGPNRSVRTSKPSRKNI